MFDDGVEFWPFERVTVALSGKAGVPLRGSSQKGKDVSKLRRDPARRGAEAARPVRSGRGACPRTPRLELGRAEREVPPPPHRRRCHPLRPHAGRLRGRGADRLPQGARDEPARARPEGIPARGVPESVQQHPAGARAAEHRASRAGDRQSPAHFRGLWRERRPRRNREAEAVKKDDVFDAILESEVVPDLPRQAMGRTLPFVRPNARVSVEDIYRLSQAAEKPAELILQTARAGADELAAALRSLDGKPHRGFALLYAAQKAFSLVPEDPARARLVADLLFAEAATLAAAIPDSRASTPAPRQAVQAEATLLKAYAFLQSSEPLLAREAIAPAREFFRESGDLGFGAALCDYYEGQAASYARDYASRQPFLQHI